MICYHGSVQRSIKVLEPHASPFSHLKYPCVYLSTNEALASIYIWNKPYKWMTFQIREDGLPIYSESFENGLREFYEGVSGCIYRCGGDFDVDENTRIKCAVVSKNPVPVESCDVVADAHERILSYEKKGLLVINHFEDLSEAQRESDRQMVLGAIRGLNLLNGTHPLSAFVAEKFPALWQEAVQRETETHAAE